MTGSRRITLGQRALGLSFKEPLLKTLKATEGEEGVEIAIRVEEVHDDIKKVTASLADTPFDSSPSSALTMISALYRTALINLRAEATLTRCQLVWER